MKLTRSYGYEPGGETPTAGFCDPLNVAMQELNNVLEQAWALGLYNHVDVVAAARVFDDNAGFWTRKWFTVPFTSQCEDKTAEVMKSVDRIRNLISKSTGSGKPPLLRPDFEETGSGGGGPFGTIPLWVKLAGGGVILILLLGQITPLVTMFKSQQRYSGLRRRKKMRR